jgi:hypothetical protein
VDCEAAGAVLLAPLELEPPELEPPELEVEGAGVGLPVSPAGIDIIMSEVRGDKLIGAVVSSTTDGSKVGKPVVVSVHLLFDAMGMSMKMDAHRKRNRVREYRQHCISTW